MPVEYPQSVADAAADDLNDHGFAVLRKQVPQEALDRALRHIHLDIAQRGLPPEELSGWLWSAHWFPHLKWNEEIVALLEHLPPEFRDGELCDPQIVLQLPDAADEVTLESHIDQEPDWANGRHYRRIVGVALGPNRSTNGGLQVWPLDGGEPVPVELEPGDVVVMSPSLPHTSGLNREGGIRYAAYFRYLEPASSG
jgi:hypothetical protein